MRHVLTILSLTTAVTLAAGCFGGTEEPDDTAATNCGATTPTDIDEQVTVSASDFVAAMGEDGELSEAECLGLCETHVTRDDVGPAVACEAPESIPDTGNAQLTLDCTFEPITECG